jgi:hypothetical protein
VTSLAPKSEGDAQATLQVLERLFALARVGTQYKSGHPSLTGAADATRAAIAEAAPPFSISFVQGAVFRKGQLVPMLPETYEKCVWLAQCLARLNIHEITFEPEMTTTDLAVLGEVLGGHGKGSDAFADVRIKGFSFRELVTATRGVETSTVDAEVFAAAQIALAVQECEELTAGDPEAPWPFESALGIVRRIERAVLADDKTALRTLELAAGGFTPARKLLSLGLRTMLLLLAAGTSLPTRRALTHLGLVLGFFLKTRGGSPIEIAATRGFASFLRRENAGTEPHRIHVSSMLFVLSTRPREAWPTALGAVDLSYQLELARSPEKFSFDLASIDLLAMAVSKLATGERARWVRLLVDALGTVPPGSVVILRDGRRAIVVGPSESSGDPFRPVVMVAGERFTADAHVKLVFEPYLAKARN